MSVKEVRQALGNWGITLKPTTPRELLQQIEQNKFGHIAIVPGRINPLQYGDGLLRTARYVGVYRSTFKQSDDTVEIKGVGMAFWLGDEDEKGDIFETAVTLNDVTFPNAIRALLPPSGAVTEGTLYSIPGAGTYKNTHQWETPRKAITYVTDTYSSGDEIIEFRVNGDATIDAGPIGNLYRMTPQAILVKKDTGRDMRLLGLQADMSMDYDVEDLTTRIVLLAEGEGKTMATASANATPTGYLDLKGNPIKLTRLVSESGTPVGTAATRAQLQLKRWSMPRQAIQIRTDEFDIKGDFVVGDYIYVFDPESGFYDLDNEVFWRGQPVNPIALRVTQMDWGIRPGWTVAFRKNNGQWLDLSEYYKSEGGSSTLAVGDFRRTLAGNNYESLGFRPNLPEQGADSTIPAAPAFTGFSVGSYQSETMTWVKSAIRAQWSEPLNTDGSTITDGGYYELRYRVSKTIGYQTDWDLLSGYVSVLNDTFGARTLSNGWGTPEVGVPYVVTAGSTANASVSSGGGRISLNARNTPQRIRVTGVNGDARGYAEVTVPVMPTGGSIATFVAVRYKDESNFLLCGFYTETSGLITCTMVQRVAGVDTFIGGLVNPGITHIAGQTYSIEFNVFGNQASSKVWVKGTPEPANWTNSGTITNPVGDQGFGVHANLDALNTNAFPVSITFDNLSVYEQESTAAYSWDSLGTWDGMLSEPVAANPQWQSSVAGWDAGSYTIMELTPGITYELQIRAVDASNPPKQSAWSPSSLVTTVGDIFAPSTPAAPTVAASMIAIQVQHNLGKSSGGEFNLEVDLNHIDVHVGGSDSFMAESSNKVGELIATGAMVKAGIPAIGTFKIDQTVGVFVKVVAVDVSGNKSPASNAVQATVDLVDDAHISDLTVSKVTAGTITATWIMAGAIKTAQTGARVVIDSTGIEAFNAAGSKTVDVNSSDGSATFTGKLQTELNQAGVTFETFGGQVQGRWSVRQSGAVLDHHVREWAAPFPGLGGQGFETSIRRSSDDAQDGSKLLLTELSTILSHQPDVGEEAFISLGDWPSGVPQAIYMRGKFPRQWIQDSNGAVFNVVDPVGAGFGGATYLYGPTMSEYMNVNASITGVAGDNCVLTASNATTFTVTWNGGAAHVVYVWAVRVDAP